MLVLWRIICDVLGFLNGWVMSSSGKVIIGWKRWIGSKLFLCFFLFGCVLIMLESIAGLLCDFI